MQAAAKRQEEAEEEQSRLAALEEFERADALNEVIHTCSAESEARQAVLRDLRASVRLLEETFAQERAECISNFHRACNSLRVTREQLGLALAQVQSSSSRQFEMEESRIRAELERIGLEKGHFQREEEALQGDAERTEEVIRAQTVDLSAKKGELEASIGVLDEEILLLQQQLAAKMAAQQQLSKELGQVDGKIGEVRKKYDRQLQRIADRQAALEQSKRECLQEESAVMLEQTSLQRQVQNSKECHSSAAQWAHALETDVTIAEALLSNLSPTRSASSADRCALASINRLEASSEDVSTQELRRNIDAINYLLSKKRALVVELQDQHDSLLTEARRVGELLPKLDAEKKAHAASKRFKEAAAVAKELKELQAAKDASDAEVERLSTLMDNTLVEVSALEEKHAASSKALRDAHRQHDVSRFEALLLRVQEVRALQKQVHKEVRKRKRVAGVGEEGARTGGEGGEGHSGPAELFEAAGRFFSSELLSCLSEAAAIKERHALPQELDYLDVDLSEGSDSDISDLEGVDANASGGETAVNNGGVSEDAENMSSMDLKGGGSVVAADVDEDLVLHEDAKHSTDIGREDCSGAEEEEEQAPVIVLTAARATSAPVESDSANGSVESSLASGGDSGGNSGGAAHRDTMMLQAQVRLFMFIFLLFFSYLMYIHIPYFYVQALLLSIEEINVRLEEATDYEDYEKVRKRPLYSQRANLSGHSGALPYNLCDLSSPHPFVGPH